MKLELTSGMVLQLQLFLNSLILVSTNDKQLDEAFLLRISALKITEILFKIEIGDVNKNQHKEEVLYLYYGSLMIFHSRPSIGAASNSTIQQ